MHDTTMPADQAADETRDAAAELGQALRTLLETVVRTTASAPALRELAQGVRSLTGELHAPLREPGQIPDTDVFPGGPRLNNPASGPGHPFAPPMQISEGPNGLVGVCTLGTTHEGPPAFAHGGMSAMLLDDLMGWACTAIGAPSMTISLDLRYHRPVPLHTPLRVTADVSERQGRKSTVQGSIATLADPGMFLVSAQAHFLEPDPARARSLFPAMS